jgi:hypothetical protein
MVNQENPTPNLSHEIIHKELDLIQDVVKRMATNSFQVKAWLIGVLSALVVIEGKSIFAQANGNNAFSIEMNLFLFLPIFCFWYLDAFFLSTEKLYRELYKWVITYRPITNAYLYDLNTFVREANGVTENLIKEKNSLWKTMFSKTLLLFYVVPLLFVFGLLFFNSFR